tara:strand:+ start:50508 stop:50723 length:216 start_codon:yes stop_codon:yes gene_type:complete
MKWFTAFGAVLAFLTLQGCCDTYLLPESGTFASEEGDLVRVVIATEGLEQITETYVLGNHIYTVRYEVVSD